MSCEPGAFTPGHWMGCACLVSGNPRWGAGQRWGEDTGSLTQRAYGGYARPGDPLWDNYFGMLADVARRAGFAKVRWSRSQAGAS